MAIGFRYLAPPEACAYLPDRDARMEYEFVASLDHAEYSDRIGQGWRRFGRTLFRPRCASCQACRPLRVDVERYRPDRSQRRARRANRGRVHLDIGEPQATRANIDLHRRYHEAQAAAKGWPPPDRDAESYWSSFVDNPFTTQEWRYWLGTELIGVGYVDDLGTSLSAIYFFHDPSRRDLSMGTYNILCLVDRAAALGYEHVHLGYYVADCGSLAYKARFRPNQVLGPDGRWTESGP